MQTTEGGFADALGGVRVVELPGGVAGEHCGYALAGLGASVLAIRPPQPAGAGHPLDATKRIVALDPASEPGFEELVCLTADCVLVIEDRPAPGWPADGPLSPKLLQRNPHLIAVCLSPFGLSGPYADYAAYPLNCYHAGGHAQQIPCDALRPEDTMRAPLQPGGQWGEAQAGALAAVAALACLLDARHHRGTIIDCSKQEALISFNWTDVARFANEGRSPTRLAPLATIVGGVLPTCDGFVQVAVREDHQWAALARLLERPEWIRDPLLSSRAARTGRWREVARLLAVETRKFATRHLHLQGRELGIPIAAVFGLPELLDDPDLAARGVWQQVDGAGVKRPRWDACITQPAAPAVADAATAKPAPSAGPPQAGSAGGCGKPLNGLRVLDLGWVAMGPYAGYLLACLGAEVIHVARPRQRDPSGVDLAAYNYGFDSLNTGKTWIGIDLQRSEGVELVRELAKRCDIVLENFRPGVSERLGVGFAALSALNPRLVMVSASTYGRCHMRGAYVGYAPVFSALAGLASLTGYPDGPPAEVSTPVDFFAGSVGVLGLLAGLHRRAATGAGCHIDLSAREAVAWSLSHEMVLQQTGQSDGRRLGNGDPDMAPHGVYRCRGDNRWLSLAVGTDAEWQGLCDCIGEAGLGADARFLTKQGRLEHREQIDRQIEGWTRSQDVWELVERLQAGGVAAFPSATSEDLCGDRHLLETGAFLSRPTQRGTRWYLAPPWRFGSEPRHPLKTTEGRTAITAVFGNLIGLSAERIDRLQSDGVIATR